MNPYRRIGIDDDVALEHRARGVLSGRLASATWQPQQLHTASGIAGDDIVRRIRRRIRHDDDLAPLRRIVEGEKTLDSMRDRSRLVVGGKHDADERPVRGGLRRRRCAAAEGQQLEQRGIGDVGIERDAQRNGERDVRRDRHGSTGTGDPEVTSW